ncbi:uncharacterized protein LOC103516867 [Diaphorina citri]|uniref:Uncharacterized protein LOC103516867 n=1 Tax=Diaphorina citri TaxID=121845 RepID=A0A1S3DEL1_DIACI|nr:uncharacterized protein LOC103516867 [Diaphorina citri]
MLKTFWHSKRLWSTRKTNHTNRPKPHKSILKLHNLHKSFLTVKHNGPLRDKKDGNVKTVGRTSQSEQTKDQIEFTFTSRGHLRSYHEGSTLNSCNIFSACSAPDR